MLYLCRFKSENEEFVKVGTTIKSVKDRFAGGKSTGFSYRSLLVFSGSIGQARDIERQVLISFSEIQIVPVSFRYGRTECFDCVAQESIVALIQKLCIDKGMVLQPVDFTESEQLVGSTSTALLDTKAEASNAGEQLAEE